MFAFETEPDYQSVIDSHKTNQVLDAIDSESSSNVLQYSLPISHFLNYETNDKQLDVSLGSLDGKKFYIQQRLKIKESLDDDWDFKLNWWQHGDYDQNNSQFMWGASRIVQPHIRVGLIGSAYHEKAKNDLGAEVVVQKNKNSYWQFTYLRPDFQRNKRSDNNERWALAPQLLSSKYFFKNSDVTHLIFLKIEPRYSKYWVDSTDELSAKNASLGWTHSRPNLRTQLQSDIKSEEYNKVKTESIYTQARFEKDLIWQSKKLTYGTGYFFRKFQRTSDFAEYHDLLPFIWWHLDKWSLGYDLNIHNAQDNDRLSKSDHKDKIENRFNAKWLHTFSANAQLGLLFTFDIDEFGSSETWQGGGAHFSATF